METSNGYTLFVRQQPIASRACGSADRPDRRPIDPIVIVQLSHTNYTQLFADGEKATFFCVATLIEDPEKLETNQGQTSAYQPVSSNLLTGTILSSIFYLKDPAKSSQTGAFFVFPDLNIRSEGTYKLRFDVFRMIEQEVFPVANCISTYFTVFSAKRFPGMTNSTELSKTFSDQGLKIRIRKDIRVRKKARTGDEGSSRLKTSSRDSNSPEARSDLPEQQSYTRAVEQNSLPVDESEKMKNLNSSYSFGPDDRLRHEKSIVPKQNFTEVLHHHHHHHHFQNSYNHDFEGYFNDLHAQPTRVQLPLTSASSYDSSNLTATSPFEQPAPANNPPRQQHSAGEDNAQQRQHEFGPPVKVQPRRTDRKPEATDTALWRTASSRRSLQPITNPLAPLFSRPSVPGMYSQLLDSVAAPNALDSALRTPVTSSSDTIPLPLLPPPPSVDAQDSSQRLPSFGEAFAAFESTGDRSRESPYPSTLGNTYPGSFPAHPRQI